MDESFLWHAQEYERRENSTDWYWAVGIISISLAFISILFGNILFAILIVIAAFTLSIMTLRVPHTLEFEINSRGIRIDKYFYPYGSLESFWVETQGQPKVLIKSTKKLMPLIAMPIEDYHPLDIRDYLSDRLPEEELHEPFTQHIMDYLGF